MVTCSAATGVVIGLHLYKCVMNDGINELLPWQKEYNGIIVYNHNSLCKFVTEISEIFFCRHKVFSN